MKVGGRSKKKPAKKKRTLDLGIVNCDFCLVRLTPELLYFKGARAGICSNCVAICVQVTKDKKKKVSSRA